MKEEITPTKSYICEFRNKVFSMPTNMVFLKFGWTGKADVLERFNHPNDDYSDWDIIPKFSMWHPSQEDAEFWEQNWLKYVFPNPGPNKVWVEKYLNCPSDTYYKGLSGITELRLVTRKQAKWVLYKAYESKEKLLA